MNFLNYENFKQIFVKNFIIFFFTGLVILSLLPNPELFMRKYPDQKWFLYIMIPSINGILTTLVTFALNRYFAQKNYTKRYYTTDTRSLVLLSFLAGFLSLYLTLFSATTYLIALMIIYLAVLNVKEFAGRITELLAPQQMASAKDLGEFANFFITLLITFSVINLSINTIHSDLNIEQAFNFGKGITGIIDALYFSIITMTTVGYGHITPNDTIARIVVSFECLTSYLMLGIMIGIITRGINFNAK